MKKISIITVCLNAVKTIEQTIKSVVNQTYGIDNIEYIVIDGNSDDGTKKIIEKYFSYIDYYISESDSGLYNAMNKGIKVASGDIIGILNADDWYESDTIEKVVQSFSCDIDILYGNIYKVERDERITLIRKPGLLSDIWYSMSIWHPAVFVRKRVYEEEGGFDEKYSIAADYEFILRCYVRKKNFAYIDKRLTYFRSAGISSNKNVVCAQEANDIISKYIMYAPEKSKVLKENEYRIMSAYFIDKLLYDDSDLLDTINTYYSFIVWGTGVWGDRIISLLEKYNKEILYLVDSDEKKQVEGYKGYAVKDSSCLFEENEAYVIVAMKKKLDDVNDVLQNAHISHMFLEDWIKIVAVGN